jgi:hypothetical protein
MLLALQEDLTLVWAATAVATTLNCVSPGLAQVGGLENFEAVGAFGRLVLTVCMLLGRLVNIHRFGNTLALVLAALRARNVPTFGTMRPASGRCPLPVHN